MRRRLRSKGVRKAIVQYSKTKDTMGDNLLISLQRYAQRPTYNPLENFITEVFAWLLRNNSSVEKAFLSLIERKSRPETRASIEKATCPGHWTSQRLLSKENGIIDLLGVFENFVLVIEIGSVVEECWKRILKVV